MDNICFNISSNQEFLIFCLILVSVLLLEAHLGKSKKFKSGSTFSSGPPQATGSLLAIRRK